MSSSNQQTSERLEKFQRVFSKASMSQDVYGGSELITVEWANLDELCDVHITMQHESGRIYAEVNTMLEPETTTVPLRKGLNAPDGLYFAVIRPKAGEYYGDTPYEVKLPFYVVNTQPSFEYYGDNESRRLELLRDVARRGPDVFSEMARLELGESIRGKSAIIARENEDWIGILFILGRYRDRLPPDLVEFLNDLFKNLDSYNRKMYPTDFIVEAVVAKLFNRKTDDAIENTKKWLLELAKNGFDLVSITPSHEIIIALIVLIDLVDELSEIATVVLDKLLYTFALHPTDFYRDQRLSPLSSVSRLLWGIGTWNHLYATAIMLACSENYEIPSLIQAIAIDRDNIVNAIDIHKPARNFPYLRTVYRTPDYTLVSTQQGWSADVGAIRVNLFDDQCFDDDQLVTGHHKNKLTFLTYAGNWLISFPQHATDQWIIVDNWAFAQIGSAYIALHCDVDITWWNHPSGRNHYLTTQTHHKVAEWYCRMGRADEDGLFDEFCKKVQAEGVQEVVPEELPENRHYQSPYCEVDFGSPTMEIRYEDYVMRLDFSETSEEE